MGSSPPWAGFTMSVILTTKVFFSGLVMNLMRSRSSQRTRSSLLNVSSSQNSSRCTSLMVSILAKTWGILAFCSSNWQMAPNLNRQLLRSLSCPSSMVESWRLSIIKSNALAPLSSSLLMSSGDTSSQSFITSRSVNAIQLSFC